jgi:hypothetical protein
MRRLRVGKTHAQWINARKRTFLTPYTDIKTRNILAFLNRMRIYSIYMKRSLTAYSFKVGLT